MTTTTRFRAHFLAVLLLTFGCKGGGVEGEDAPDPADPLAQLCVDSCLKTLCMGDPPVSPDYEQYCESRCEMRVAQAEEDDCAREYEDVLMCLDATSCSTYQLWYNQDPGAPCTDLEMAFVSLCTEIDLRELE